MGEHTQSRWTIRHNEWGEPRIVADPNPSEEGRRMGAEWVIADKILAFRDPEEQQADARLIAAAPRMKAALEQAVTSMLDSGYSVNSVAVRECQYALADARGERQ